jgi:hypothetical protein
MGGDAGDSSDSEDVLEWPTSPPQAQLAAPALESSQRSTGLESRIQQPQIWQAAKRAAALATAAHNSGTSW